MTSLNRVVLEWAGPSIVGRAVSVLHYSASDNVAPPVAAIQAALQGIHVLIPAGTTITVPAAGDVINDVDGSLVGTWSVASANVASMDGAAASAAGVGACIGMTTGGIVPGKKGPRRLRGRMFIVPLSTSAYDGSGTLTPGAQSGLQGCAQGLLAAGPLAVWHRPNKTLSLPGNSYGVQSVLVKDKVAYLSSRRD